MIEFLVLLLMQVTVFSSITALIIITVKQIFKCRISPRIGMVMWIVLLARLISPIFPESEISVYNFIPVGREIMYTLTNDIGDEISIREEARAENENPYVLIRDNKTGEETENSVSKPRLSDASAPVTIGEYIINEVGDDAQKNAHMLDVAILALYALGAASALGVSLYAYRRAKKLACFTLSPCTDEAMLSLYEETAKCVGVKREKLPPLMYGSTSMLVGCVSPVVIFREDTDKKEARLIFAHELNHFKHGDNPLLVFSTIVASLFWYNPLIWIVRNMLRDDVEVLCDQRTLESLGQVTPSEYAFMIYRNSVDNGMMKAAGCGMSANGRSLKKRLRTISHGKNKTFVSRTASFLLCGAIIAICLTNPIVSENSDYKDYIKNYSALTGENERVLSLSSSSTVSAYLTQLAAILENECAPEFRAAVGNGSLEKFKRLTAESGAVSKETAAEVAKLRTDDILTTKNCALINSCAAALIGGGSVTEVRIDKLPEYITVSDMESILLSLTEAESAALLKCYNRGVRGADVEFDKYYSEAMMQLILSRINDSWSRGKFMGFYSKLDISRLEGTEYSEELADAISDYKKNETVYILDPNVTANEEKTLRAIIGRAVAGEKEDVYYLKGTEDGCPTDIARFLLRRGGYTYDNVLAGYAKIGETGYSYTSRDDCATLTESGIRQLAERLDGSGYDVYSVYEADESDGETVYRLADEAGFGAMLAYLNRAGFCEVRGDMPEVSLRSDSSVSRTVLDYLRQAYTLGLIDIDENTTAADLSEKLSPGQGLCYAYRVAASVVNVNE